MGRTKSLAAAMVIAAANAAAAASCSADSSVKAALDAATEDASPDQNVDQDGGARSDASGPRSDAAVLDAGPCPGLTSCGSACVQTRTDMNNCGACGVVCAATAPSTATCAIGKCIVTLATSSTGDLALQGTHVYWANAATGTISRVPMAGGTVETLVTGQSQPHSIVANATSIYWVVTGANGIWKAPLGGSAVPTQVTLFSPGQINDLAIDATSAYYTTGLGYVMSVPLAGASSAKQVTKGGSQFSQRLALDSSKVYFTETGTTIYAAPIDGGVATSIAFSSAIPQSGLALTSTDIVWGTNSATMKVALDGGAATQRAAAPAYGLASDSDEIFGFTSTGSIIKFPMSGALPTTLSFRDTTNADDIHDIAVDANAVYWTETVGNVGRVMKLSPK